MKPWELMSATEKEEFQAMIVRVWKIMKAAEACAPVERRPAMLALWVVCHDRSVVNVHTQHEIDPWATVDDAVRRTVLLMENLMSAIVETEPPAGLKQYAYRVIANTITVLRAPTYRTVIDEELRDFFQDQREQGKL